MKAQRKSTTDALNLGNHLRDKRKLHQLTLEEVAVKTGINVGQLSRFERGDFVFLSQNLQIFRDFLQRLDTPAMLQPKLVARFAAVLGKSDRHSAAAGAMLSALEALE